VRAHIGPKFWVLWGPAPLGYWAWLTPAPTPPVLRCYHTEFGHSRSNRLGLGMGNKNLEMLGPRILGW